MARILSNLIAAVLLALAPAVLAQEPPAAGIAVVLDIDGAIGPATAEYVHAGLAEAARRNARVVVLRLDTPGGLSSSMREIIHDILDSPVPVIAYVAPSGARAASAGTYILYASHLAAMAPSTHLGAATPVALGGGLFGSDKKDDKKDAKSAEEAKAVNDAIAYIRSLAQLRGRNAEWAEKAVREAATLTNSEAKEQRVIELTADSLTDLLQQADGRSVKLGSRELTLATRGLKTETRRARLAQQAACHHHQSQHRLSAAARRHLRHPVRVLQPGRRAARRDRRHFAADRGLRAQSAADQLRRRRRSCCSASP